MALDYTQSPTVIPGSPISSAQWNKLADAFNDRLSQGVGDPTWRLHWYWHSLFRALRLNNGFSYAPEDEWWKIYAHVDVDNYEFPVASAGMPEGANPGNPINGFVFGNPDQDIKSEAGRLSYDSVTGEGVKLHDGVGNPTTDKRKWLVGAEQRGAVLATDLDDLTLAPALVAARAHFNFGFFHWYQKAYGGFLPGPKHIGTCEGHPDSEEYQLKFTNTATGTTTNYSTCPGDANGVYAYTKSSRDFVLIKWDGTITRLPIANHTEGPYTENAFLKHTPGGQLERSLNYFAQPFRGTAAEQAQSGYKVEEKAFDFNKFLTTQYYLSPARGEVNSDGVLEAVYNKFNFDPGTAINSYGLVNETSATSFTTATGFVCAGVLACRSGGTGEKTFQIEVGGSVAGTVTVGASEVSKSLWFATPGTGTVKVKCLTAMGASDDFYVEVAELMEYLPENEDAYLVLRLGSASNLTYDAEGTDTTTPKDISDAYFRHGMVHNANRADVEENNTALNANPVYRSVAKEVNKRLRMIDRHGIIGYEVDGSGRSVLTFKREAFGISTADMFTGIGPGTTAITSGNLVAGRKYKVVGGSSITYNSATIAADATFDAVEGVDTFTAAGSEEVFEFEGIRATAEPGGYDNQWLMHMESMSYKPSIASAYKPDSYTDIIGYKHDRCSTFSMAWTYPETREILTHVTPLPGQTLQRSENPPGYRYVLGTHQPASGNSSFNLLQQANGTGASGDPVCSPLQPEGSEGNCTGLRGHYKSCQVYRPDYKVHSATRVEPANPGELPQIKVTLTTRLQHNEDAPSSIANTSTSRASYISADSTGSTNGGYRTDENAIVEYLRYTADGGAGCGQRIGDTAPDAAYTQEIDGACMPRFFFTRQLPKVYEDGNATYQTQDTLAKTEELTWAESVLRAICHGFVDTQSNTELIETINPGTGLATCEDKRLYDFTFENLMLQANSKQHYKSLPTTVRADGVKGHGPLPSQPCYADHFNQLGQAVNLLTRARLYVPLHFEYRFIFYRSEESLVGRVNTNQSTVNCSGGAVWADNIASVPTWVHQSTGAWTDSSTPAGVAEKYCRINSDSAGNCILECYRKDMEYKVGLEYFSFDSLPTELRTLVENGTSVGFAVADGVNTVSTVKTQMSGSSTGWTGNSTDPDDYYHGGNYWDWDETRDPISQFYDNTCKLSQGEVLIAPAVPTSNYVDTVSGNFGTFAEGNRSVYADSAQAFVAVPTHS